MNNITNSRAGYVYLVWAIGTPRYKIGKSKNPSKRMESLNQQSCYPLKLIESCYFDDCDRQEKRLHRLLNKWQKHGEWFEIPQPLLLYTQSWFHNPRCESVQGIGEGGLVVYTGKQKTPTKKILLEELQAVDIGFTMTLPKHAKLPKTLEDLDRAIILLGSFIKLQEMIAKGQKAKGNRLNSGLQSILGALPLDMHEAKRWKATLKEIKRNKQEKDIPLPIKT